MTKRVNAWNGQHGDPRVRSIEQKYQLTVSLSENICIFSNSVLFSVTTGHFR